MVHSRAVSGFGARVRHLHEGISDAVDDVS
jgi:hypothetical protein